MSKIKDTQFLHEGIQVVNYDWQYVSVNDVAVLQSGKKKEHLIGYKMDEVFPVIRKLPLFDILQQCMKDRLPSRFENHFIYANGSSIWFDIRVQPCTEGISIYSVDITERKATESRLKKANGLYAFLTQISQKIVTVKDEDQLFKNCSSLALRFGEFNMAWIGLFDANLKTIKMIDHSGIPTKELPLFYEALKNPNEQLDYIIQSGKYYISTDVQNEPALKLWHQYARKHAIKSCILLPIRKSGKIIGLFSLYSKELDFSEDEIALLQQVTTDISNALDIFEQVKKQRETQTLLMQKEQHFRHTLDHMIEGVQIHDFNWRYTYVNETLVGYSTYTKEELLGYSLMEKYPGIEQTAIFNTLSHCMKERIAEKIETEFVFPDGSKAHFELSIQPVPEGLFILSIDRTEQVKAKDKLLKTNRLYAFNSAINQTIVHINNEQELLDNTCRVAYEIGKFKLSWIKMLEDGNIKRVSMAGIEEAIVLAAPFGNLPINDPALCETTTELVLRTGKYAVSNDVMNDPSMTFWKPYMLAYGVQSSISLPIKKFGVTVGVFGLHSDTIDFFDIDEIALLEELTNNLSFALENFENAKKNKAIEEQMEQNEKRFRALVEKGADIQTLTNIEGEIIYASKSVTKILGYVVEEFLQMPITDFMHPVDLIEFKTKRDGILGSAGAAFDFENRAKHKDGRWIWFEGSVTNMLHEPGVMAMVANFRDITHKKVSEQQRDFDNKNLNALINNTNDLLWSIDCNYNLITSNTPFDLIATKIQGYTPKKGENVLKSTSIERAERFRSFFDRALSGEMFSIIEHNLTPNEFWSEISFYPIQMDNQIVGTACHSRNITERIKSEQLLRKSEIFNRGILDSLSAHIAVINKKGEIITVNESWRRFAIENGDTELKATSEGNNYFKVYDTATKQDENTNTLAQIQEVLNGNIFDFYYEYPCHSPTDQRWFSMLVKKFESDEPLIVISHQDITERKIVENQLIMNNVALQKTNYELDRFVYSVSHDLRSPLTSILGLANIIEIECKEPEILLQIGMIKSSIIRLDNLIKNILNYSRNNRTEIEIETIPLNAIINEIVALLCLSKECEDIEFEINIIEEYPFYSDKYRFIMIMENLISNAIKYHKKEKEGRFIKITGQSLNDLLEIRVEDNGIGIAPNYHSKIFDMFFRIANTTNGSGIGLYIVKESIRKLKGTIVVDSKEGKGTTFTIQLKNLQP